MQRLVDAHTHTQPSAAATQAFLAGLPYRRASPPLGTVEELLAGMDRHGVDWTLVVPWLPARALVEAAVAEGQDRDAATEQVVGRWQALNGWAARAAAEQPDRLVAVVGLDPLLMPADVLAAEVSTRLAEGASGLKVAPTYVGVRPDDERMEPLWRLAREHGVPVLAESSSTQRDLELCGRPEHYREVLRSYPDVRLQLAHLGRGGEAELARLTDRHPQLYTDTALRLGGPGSGDVGVDELVAQVRAIGTDRVLFGSNYPIVDQGEYAATLRALPLTEDELRDVGHDNAERLWRGR